MLSRCGLLWLLTDILHFLLLSCGRSVVFPVWIYVRSHDLLLKIMISNIPDSDNSAVLSLSEDNDKAGRWLQLSYTEPLDERRNKGCCLRKTHKHFQCTQIKLIGFSAYSLSQHSSTILIWSPIPLFICESYDT